MPNSPKGARSPQARPQLARAVIASTRGTTIEWLYFPNSESLVGTLQVFGIFAVGFLARPIVNLFLLNDTIMFKRLV